MLSKVAAQEKEVFFVSFDKSSREKKPSRPVDWPTSVLPINQPPSRSSSRSLPVVTPKTVKPKNSLYPDLTSKRILYSVFSTPPVTDDECDLVFNKMNKMVMNYLH